MTNIVVAFSKLDDGKSIKNILMRSGFQVVAVCTTASQVLNTCSDWEYGIVVSGFRFADMMYEEMRDCLPSAVEMLLISSPDRWSRPVPRGILCLPMPLKVRDLVNTLEMMVQAQMEKKRRRKSQPRKRNEEDKILIEKAKAILMERNNMTESEAHRYIQKCSMDSGTNMVETAQMVLSLM
ncbi:MAG: ANTAR domain-containing protein [Lachnospiraceae bacterium]|nr:ANTAR domain-containing protein [Lachnospiraceae bacterium]